MSRKLSLIVYVAITSLLFAACGGDKNNDKKSDENNAEVVETSDKITLEHGMLLQDIIDLPGISWQLDTLKGVCVDDTLLLWLKFDNRYYPTNVLGVPGLVDNLTESGQKTLKTPTDSLILTRNDFRREAALAKRLDISRDAFMHVRDSIYEKKVTEMANVALDFFLSYGRTDYMSLPLAAKWQRSYDAAADDGKEAPNPFNGSYYVEFDTENISVDVVDAPHGQVIVRTFCLDENTLGRQGWAEWEMKMMKEGSYYKVHTLPKLHH